MKSKKTPSAKQKYLVVADCNCALYVHIEASSPQEAYALAEESGGWELNEDPDPRDCQKTVFDMEGNECISAELVTPEKPVPAAFTPGPWRTDWLGSQHGWILDERSNYIAEIVTDDDCGFVVPQDQQQANARLIAAAPELLEALDYLLQQTVGQDLAHGIELTEGEQEARRKTLALFDRIHGKAA